MQKIFVVDCTTASILFSKRFGYLLARSSHRKTKRKSSMLNMERKLFVVGNKRCLYRHAMGLSFGMYFDCLRSRLEYDAGYLSPCLSNARKTTEFASIMRQIIKLANNLYRTYRKWTKKDGQTPYSSVYAIHDWIHQHGFDKKANDKFVTHIRHMRRRNPEVCISEA